MTVNRGSIIAYLFYMIWRGKQAKPDHSLKVDKYFPISSLHQECENQSLWNWSLQRRNILTSKRLAGCLSQFSPSLHLNDFYVNKPLSRQDPATLVLESFFLCCKIHTALHFSGVFFKIIAWLFFCPETNAARGWVLEQPRGGADEDFALGDIYTLAALRQQLNREWNSKSRKAPKPK